MLQLSLITLRFFLSSSNIYMQFKVNGFPYIRLDSTIHHFVKAADDYLSDNEGKVNKSIRFSNGNSV